MYVCPCRDASSGAKTAWSAVMKSPNFPGVAYSSGGPCFCFLQCTRCILQSLQISHLGSLGKCVKLCSPRSQEVSFCTVFGLLRFVLPPSDFTLGGSSSVDSSSSGGPSDSKSSPSVIQDHDLLELLLLPENIHRIGFQVPPGNLAPPASR